MTQTYRKPLPLVDEDSQEFWDAAKKHKLLIQSCPKCNTRYHNGFVCHLCGAKTEYVEASGKGRVYTWVIFHQKYHASFEADLPYNVAIVELEEGPLYMTNLVGVKNEEIRLNMPVQVVFDDVTEEISLPKFRPV